MKMLCTSTSSTYCSLFKSWHPCNVYRSRQRSLTILAASIDGDRYNAVLVALAISYDEDRYDTVLVALVISNDGDRYDTSLRNIVRYDGNRYDTTLIDYESVFLQQLVIGNCVNSIEWIWIWECLSNVRFKNNSHAVADTILVPYGRVSYVYQYW